MHVKRDAYKKHTGKLWKIQAGRLSGLVDY